MFSCILWDFGDTLADEKWMLPEPDGFSDWTEAYRYLVWESDLGVQWNTGKIGSADVANHIASEIGADPELIAEHMALRCRHVDFFTNAMKAAKSCDLPQALVTINSDVFSDHVLPNYELDQIFDHIVTSWQAGTLDKADLCDIAIARFSVPIDRQNALLIDNKLDLVESWRARGGVAYHFTTDAEFGSHPPAPFTHLF